MLNFVTSQYFSSVHNCGMLLHCWKGEINLGIKTVVVNNGQILEWYHCGIGRHYDSTHNISIVKMWKMEKLKFVNKKKRKHRKQRRSAYKIFTMEYNTIIWKKIEKQNCKVNRYSSWFMLLQYEIIGTVLSAKCC